jgi:hypothetical protein
MSETSRIVVNLENSIKTNNVINSILFYNQLKENNYSVKIDRIEQDGYEGDFELISQDKIEVKNLNVKLPKIKSNLIPGEFCDKNLNKSKSVKNCIPNSNTIEVKNSQSSKLIMEKMITYSNLYLP